MNNEFKQRVFLTMLPIIYREIDDDNGRLVSSRSHQAVEAAAEIAEAAERRLCND